MASGESCFFFSFGLTSSVLILDIWTEESCLDSKLFKFVEVNNEQQKTRRLYNRPKKWRVRIAR